MASLVMEEDTQPQVLEPQVIQRRRHMVLHSNRMVPHHTHQPLSNRMVPLLLPQLLNQDTGHLPKVRVTRCPLRVSCMDSKLLNPSTDMPRFNQVTVTNLLSFYEKPR